MEILMAELITLALTPRSSSLVVADFSHHDDIRVLTQSRAQTLGESITLFGFCLCLHDAIKVIFYWIFYSHHFNIGRINLFQESIKGRGLARAGWASGEDHTVRLPNFFLKNFKEAWMNTEPFKFYSYKIRIQNTQHY